MADYGLRDWDEVSDDRDWPVLLLGNGFSRAVSESFSYGSLFEVAPLVEDDRNLFDALTTTNFEEVLYHLRSSILVCQQLGHNHIEVEGRYESIRDALIQAVHDHHVTWEGVTAGDRLVAIQQVLRQHRAVFTTSYDLVIYWAMLADGGIDAGLVDLFWGANHVFDPFDAQPHAGKIPVYWLHGALHMERTISGETQKRTNQGANLLATFGAGDQVPLFVSEGTSQQKLRVIRRSNYLDHTFQQLSQGEGALVIYGQGLGNQDRHIASAIRRRTNSHVAYGVFADSQASADLQVAEIENRLLGCDLTFFDSRTHDLGNPALLVP